MTIEKLHPAGDGRPGRAGTRVDPGKALSLRV